MAGRWDMTDPERARVRESMSRAAMRGVPGDASVTDLIGELGNSRVAEILSGSSDKKSRGYRSALRNVQRWQQGRQPARRTVERVTAARRREAATRLRTSGGVGYQADAKWTTSKSPWIGTAKGRLTGRRLDQFSQHVENGDWESAAEMLAGDYFGDDGVVIGVSNFGVDLDT